MIAGLAVGMVGVPTGLAALATTYVLLMAIIGPVAAWIVEPVVRKVRLSSRATSPAPGSGN